MIFSHDLTKLKENHILGKKISASNHCSKIVDVSMWGLTWFLNWLKQKRILRSVDTLYFSQKRKGKNLSCFRSLHDGVGGSWRIGSKKLFMPFRAPTSHGNTPFRTTFRHPFHPANITRTLLSTWILSAFEVPYVLRLIQSYVVFLQHQIHSSLSGTSVRWVRWND